MKTFIVMMAVLAGMVMPIQAGTVFYGFGAMSTDNFNGRYTLDRARVGVRHSMSDTTLSQQFEYNTANNSVVFANVRKDFYLGDAVLSVIGGTHLSGPHYLWVGAKKLQTPRWSTMHDLFTGCTNGVQAQFRYYALMTRFSHAKASSATVSFGSLSFLWEDRKGYGFLLETRHDCLLNPSAGYMKLTNGTVIYFIQNYVQVTERLRFYAQADLGDFSRGGLAGFTYEYSTDSYVRLYYDSKRSDYWVAGATFSFQIP